MHYFSPFHKTIETAIYRKWGEGQEYRFNWYPPFLITLKMKTCNDRIAIYLLNCELNFCICSGFSELCTYLLLLDMNIYILVDICSHFYLSILYIYIWWTWNCAHTGLRPWMQPLSLWCFGPVCCFPTQGGMPPCQAVCCFPTQGLKLPRNPFGGIPCGRNHTGINYMIYIY